jgi:hypothetical protein
VSDANDLTRDLIEAIVRRWPDTVNVWRQNRVEATAIRAGGRKGHISAGINGQGDITGLALVNVVLPSGGTTGVGVRIELEVKATHGKRKDSMRPTQLAFRAMAQKLGGIYLTAYSVEQGVADLATALQALA